MATQVRKQQISFSHSIIHFLNKLGARIEHASEDTSVIMEFNSQSLNETKERYLQKANTSMLITSALMRFY